MTQDAADTIFVEYQAVTPAQHPNSPSKKQISIEEIANTFQTVAEDIQEIGKLTNQENSVVTQFLTSLKTNMEPWTSFIAVSTCIIPIDLGLVEQAFIHPTGHLALTFVDGRHELLDLSEAKYRDLMMAVIDELVPKFEALTLEIAAERLRKHAVPIIEVPTSKFQLRCRRRQNPCCRDRARAAPDPHSRSRVTD